MINMHLDKPERSWKLFLNVPIVKDLVSYPLKNRRKFAWVGLAGLTRLPMYGMEKCHVANGFYRLDIYYGLGEEYTSMLGEKDKAAMSSLAFVLLGMTVGMKKEARRTVMKSGKIFRLIATTI